MSVDTDVAIDKSRWSPTRMLVLLSSTLVLTATTSTIISADEQWGKIFSYLGRNPWAIVSLSLAVALIGSFALTHLVRERMLKVERKLEAEQVRARAEVEGVRKEGQAVEDQLRQESQEIEDELRGKIDDLAAEIDRYQIQVMDLERTLDKVSDQGIVVRIHKFDSANPSERGRLIHEAIGQARESLEVTGVVIDMTKDLGEVVLPRFFARGGRMRALFINPNGEAVGHRENLERTHQSRYIKKGDFARRTRLSIGLLDRHRDDCLEVRVYERPPTLNLLLIDRCWALFHYYDPSTIGIDTPMIEIDARNALSHEIPASLKHLNAQFDTLWDHPTSRDWAWESEQ